MVVYTRFLTQQRNNILQHEFNLFSSYSESVAQAWLVDCIVCPAAAAALAGRASQQHEDPQTLLWGPD